MTFTLTFKADLSSLITAKVQVNELDDINAKNNASLRLGYGYIIRNYRLND